MVFFERKFLFEAEDDNNEGQDPNMTNPPADDASDPNEGYTDNESEGDDISETEDGTDNTEDQNTENSETNEEDDQNTEDSEEDFTIDDADIGEGESGDAESGSEDPNSSSEDSGSEEETPVDPDSLKAKDAELFDSLSADEQKKKIRVLKQLFMDLYTNSELIINKVNIISSEVEEVNSQLKRVLKVLFELKKMIYDYLMDSFDSKSYIENEIMYTRYLAMFNSVKNITTEIKKATVDDSEEV